MMPDDKIYDDKNKVYKKCKWYINKMVKEPATEQSENNPKSKEVGMLCKM